MMTLQDKKENLIQMEWQQFYQVHNEGGRASCQEDPKTFAIMRRSQSQHGRKRWWTAIRRIWRQRKRLGVTC